VVEFDLHEALRSPAAKRTARLHWSIRLALGAGVAAVGYLAAQTQERVGWTVESAVVVGMVVVGVGLLAWIFVMTGLGATQLRVLDDGLTFRYQSGRVLQLRWNDPRLVLNAFEAKVTPSGAKVQYIEFGSGIWPVTSFLTMAALDSTVAEARKHGLAVVSRSLSDGVVTWHHITCPKAMRDTSWPRSE